MTVGELKAKMAHIDDNMHVILSYDNEQKRDHRLDVWVGAIEEDCFPCVRGKTYFFINLLN